MMPNVPAGITPPVAIATALPSANAPFIGRPVFTSPIILQGPNPATAYPSIAEVAYVGKSQSACASLARVRATP